MEAEVCRSTLKFADTKKPRSALLGLLSPVVEAAPLPADRGPLQPL